MERLTVVCPECNSSDNRTLETREAEKGTVDRRRHICRHCGVRWTTRAMVEPGSVVHATGSVVKLPANATRSGLTTKPPPTGSVQPPTGSGGGVGGALPSGLGLISLVSDPNPKASLLSGTRARARSKTPANPQFVAMRDAFIVGWEYLHGDKYLFEPKDGVALAAMLKKHPQLSERWAEMCERYFADQFWGSKRHPLFGLANNPLQFAGPSSNGVPLKTQQSRDTARHWAHREVSK